MRLIEKIKCFISDNKAINIELKNHSKKTDDIYAMGILQSLVVGYPYLPFNGGALRPICMCYILNEIIINQREMILEFGTGLSTIIMARLIRNNNLKAKIISVEHNHNWASIIESYLEMENLLQYVKIIRADLKDTDTPLGMVKWYDFFEVSKKIADEKFDFIIVDGPLANTEEIKYSRLPALFKLNNNFSDDYCLVLDDANREGEQEIIKFFRENNKDVSFSLISETLAVFRKTTNFNPVPIRY